MRFIHLYLIGYFVLVVGAALALWQAGVLAHVSGDLARHRRRSSSSASASCSPSRRANPQSPASSAAQR